MGAGEGEVSVGADEDGEEVEGGGKLVSTWVTISDDALVLQALETPQADDREL